MSERLKKAFEEASNLSEAEQDSMGEAILAMLHGPEEWRRDFEAKQKAIAMRMAKAHARLPSAPRSS